ncbi:MAG: DUF4276 family protein [Ignavibacteriales bacterium]|nr:MAG: DUF4276 family protein [Ignavibacteriales bacterium]
MNNPAFLVDGQLEQRFIQNACPNAPVRLLNCNGDKVSSSAIAKRIATHYRLLKKKYSPIVIVIDRESRCLTATEFKNEITTLLANDNISEDFIIGIADRMIENWILADKINVSKYAKVNLDQVPDVEGENGKSKIRKLIKDYHETTVGVELLKKSNPQRMFSSESFKTFFSSINNRIDCWWMNKTIDDKKF